MNFDQLSETTKISVIKKQIQQLISDIFENPSLLKDFVRSKQLTEVDAKKVLSSLHKLNYYTCFCCRKFDLKKLSFMPLSSPYDSLIHIAQCKVKSQKYL